MGTKNLFMPVLWVEANELDRVTKAQSEMIALMLKQGGRMQLAISGFDHIDRPLFQFPKVRKWFVLLLTQHPEVLRVLENRHIELALSCICGVTRYDPRTGGRTILPNTFAASVLRRAQLIVD